MRALIIATNVTPAGVEEEIRTGKHHRIDYLELSSRLPAAYMDYGTIRDSKPVRWIEEKLRLDLRQALQVARAVRKQHCDVVFSLSERVGIPLSHMLNRQVKQVVHIAHPLSPQKLHLTKALWVPNRWDVMIVLTQAEADALRKKLNLGPDRVKLLHYPVDTKFFRPPEKAVSTADQDHVQSLGLTYRDYPTLIRAMRKLPHITCHIRAGSIWVHGKTDYAGETIPDNVHMKPYVHPNVLRDRYTESRFIIVPIQQTTQWSVGCTSVLQAQAMGKAVIATRTPGMPDYVLDGETGILVEGGNPSAMAEAIDFLWKNPDKAASMGRCGREWVEANFSLDKWLDDVTEMLKTLAVT